MNLRKTITVTATVMASLVGIGVGIGVDPGMAGATVVNLTTGNNATTTIQCFDNLDQAYFTVDMNGDVRGYPFAASIDAYKWDGSKFVYMNTVASSGSVTMYWAWWGQKAPGYWQFRANYLWRNPDGSKSTGSEWIRPSVMVPSTYGYLETTNPNLWCKL